MRKESEMSGPISEWMTSLGYVPYAELSPLKSIRAIDMVGWDKDEDRIIVVEMKRSLTIGVIHQALSGSSYAHKTYCAVYSYPRPKGLVMCERLGIGVLRVVGNMVMEILEANSSGVSRWQYEAVTEMMNRMLPGGVGGVPDRKGKGPAQRVERLVEEYRQGHPTTTWKEMFERIPNHYASYQSMRTAMSLIDVRRELQARSKRGKEMIKREEAARRKRKEGRQKRMLEKRKTRVEGI
jgi:hypothetical protein